MLSTEPDSEFSIAEDIVRENLHVPNGKAFVVKKLMTSDETHHAIAKANSIGFSSIEWEYHKNYRDCTRVMIRDEALADKLWERMLPLFSVDDLAVKPFGYGTDGFWVPKGINPLFRITKYCPGQHFNIHRDGGFVVTDDFRSVYSLLVYLGVPEKGGETIFHASLNPGDEEAKEVSVVPRDGMGLIFNHECPHEGAPVISGEKYVLRTDILFQRTLRLDDGQYRSDPMYQMAESLYQESISLQKAGFPRSSTKAYVKATEIHARLSSMPKSAESSPLTILHTDVVDYLLHFMSIGDIAHLMQTCRALLYKCRSPAYWYLRYRTDFTQGLVRLKCGDQILTHDWFALYGSRYLVEKLLPIVCVDIGSRYTKFATTQLKCDRLLTERWAYEQHSGDVVPARPGEFQGKINSVFRRSMGHYWSAGSAYCDIMARVSDEEYEHWEHRDRGYAMHNYEFFPYSFPEKAHGHRDSCEKGQEKFKDPDISFGVWLEIITVISEYCLEYGHAQCPIILAVPPFLEKCKIKCLIFHMMSHTPAGYLGFIASPILVAARHRLRDAIVISVGARFASVSVVQQGSLKAIPIGKYRQTIRAYVAELPLGRKSTEVNDVVLESLTKWCKDVKERIPWKEFPVVVTGGYAILYRAALAESLGFSIELLMVSSDPEMDVAVGGLYYASLPDVKNILLKTPLEQKPDSWWSKKQKLDWETTQTALQRYHLPALDDSQQRMWDVLNIW